MPRFARIIINLHHQKVDRTYTYRLNEPLASSVKVGMMVRVPFGGRQSAEGYIVDLFSIPADEMPGELDGVPVSKVKAVQELLADKPVFSEGDLEIAKEMQRRYMAPLSACLSLFVPKVSHVAEKTVERVKLISSDERNGDGKESRLRLGQSQQRFLEALQEAGGEALLSLIRESAPITRESLRSLVNKAYISIEEESEGKPPAAFVSARTYPLPLREEQKIAYEAVAEAIESERPDEFLLHGITGSGKTEVYMQCIQKTLDAGKQAVLLVPEISLTPQLIAIFTARFSDKVGVTHSRLTDSERARLWHLCDRGEYQVMIGPRSALFMPMHDLGLVILDEEHESSYRSEQMAPHYHAREVAEMICRQKSCPLILGSATPSVETYFRAVDPSVPEDKKIRLLTMKNRAVSGSKLPEAFIKDMREEIDEGNMSIFCRDLQEQMDMRLKKKEQIILFLNRKGYSTSVSCRKCGFLLRCPRCNLPYTYHKDKNRLICHHCGKDVAYPDRCPRCSSHYLKQFGIGTQKVEEQVRSLFPEANVVRMDMSTMRSGDDYTKIYEEFRSGKGDILIGTQMVAKGFDFPNVTLVGILAADMTLNDADFHGVEKTFQLLTQVAGRAGRSAKGGEVYIQTYSPEHYCIQAAKDQDYLRFYHNEIAAREMSDCPPFTHIAQVVIQGTHEDVVKSEITSLAELMRHYAAGKNIEVLGPSPASLEKINNVYRWKILAKCLEEDRLRRYIEYTTDRWIRLNPAHELLTMDVDPMSIL